MSVPSGKMSERTAAPTRQIRTTVSPPCSVVIPPPSPSFAFAAASAFAPPPSLPLDETESTMSLSGGLAAAIFLGFQSDEADLRRRNRRANSERRAGGGAPEAAAGAGEAAAASASAGAGIDAGASPLAIALEERLGEERRQRKREIGREGDGELGGREVERGEKVKSEESRRFESIFHFIFSLSRFRDGAQHLRPRGRRALAGPSPEEKDMG